MKLAKTVAIVACAGLLSAGAMGSARHAYAQDAEQSDSDSGSWGAPGSAGAPDAAAEPDSKGPPLDVEGCWSGVVTDKGDGEGDAYFGFTQDGNKIVGDEESALYVVWPDNAYCRGVHKRHGHQKRNQVQGQCRQGLPLLRKRQGKRFGVDRKDYVQTTVRQVFEAREIHCRLRWHLPVAPSSSNLKQVSKVGPVARCVTGPLVF